MKHYAERDIIALDELGNHYGNHVEAMTAEGLHSKSDIAAELAWRDAEIERLRTANLDCVAVCEQALQAKTTAEQERDQLKDQLYKYGCEDVDVIRCLKTLAYEHNHPDAPSYKNLAKRTMDKYVERCTSIGSTLAVRDAEVIERFKDELVKSVNVAFRPHIEGVCAVVQQQISQKAKEVQS